jgi:DNA-binding transcriptional MerR regulator
MVTVSVWHRTRRLGQLQTTRPTPLIAALTWSALQVLGFLLMEIRDCLVARQGSKTTGGTFSISEVTSETGPSIDTLRYYERTGLMLKAVERAASGHRRYSERDVSWVLFLTKVRQTGMPIRQMRDYAGLVRAGRGNEDERLALLEAHREAVVERAAETQRNLEFIENKIESYRVRMALIENKLAGAS